MTQLNAEDPIYQLMLTLMGIRPPVWRRVQVPGNVRLDGLHKIIQLAMGWEDRRLYEFEMEGLLYGQPDVDDADPGLDMRDSSKTRLEQVAGENARFKYRYDFGDDWEHEVVVEKVLPAEEGREYPVCLEGEEACPPEDCGGVGGYEEFLEAVRNPFHDEHWETLRWVGRELESKVFGTEAFDLAETNRVLATARAKM